MTQPHRGKCGDGARSRIPRRASHSAVKSDLWAVQSRTKVTEDCHRVCTHAHPHMHAHTHVYTHAHTHVHTRTPGTHAYTCHETLFLGVCQSRDGVAWAERKGHGSERSAGGGRGEAGPRGRGGMAASQRDLVLPTAEQPASEQGTRKTQTLSSAAAGEQAGSRHLSLRGLNSAPSTLVLPPHPVPVE